MHQQHALNARAGFRVHAQALFGWHDALRRIDPVSSFVHETEHELGTGRTSTLVSTPQGIKTFTCLLLYGDSCDVRQPIDAHGPVSTTLDTAR